MKMLRKILNKLFSRRIFPIIGNAFLIINFVRQSKASWTDIYCLLINNHHFRAIFVEDQYQSQRFIKNDSNVIDVGANMGIFSIRAAAIAKGGKVFAFEPSPDTFDKLRQNSRRYSNISCLDSALGNKISSAQLAVASDCPAIDTITDSQYYKDSSQKYDEFKKIKMITLDSFVKLNNVKKVDFIKIDSEGYELKVLEGARQTIKKFSPVIAVSAYHNKNDIDRIPEFIQKVGVSYRYELVNRSELLLFFWPKKSIKKERILIVGNVSQDYHLGSMLVRSAKILGCEISELDTNYRILKIPPEPYWGKVFYKLFKIKRIKDWAISGRLINQINKNRFDIIIVTGIIPLKNRVFRLIQNKGMNIVNYLTDDPWNHAHLNKIFIENIASYNTLFSTKKNIVPDLKKAGAKNIFFIPFGFDPQLHKKVRSRTTNDAPNVCFIGAADEQRAQFIGKFLKHFTGSFGLFGSDWFKFPKLKKYYKGNVYNDAYCQAIAECKINLGMVRHLNRDQHTMRTFEIAACGGVGIYEDTKEHREIFKDLPEMGFFSTAHDLANKCEYLLRHAKQYRILKKTADRAICTADNTYTRRLEQIIELTFSNPVKNGVRYFKHAKIKK